PAGSSERSLGAMAQVTAYGKHLAVARANEAAKPFAGMPKLTSGPQVEWVGKQVLAAAGIAVPQGALARTVDEAVATAGRIGYPVVLKAKAAALMPQNAAGGMMLTIAADA